MLGGGGTKSRIVFLEPAGPLWADTYGGKKVGGTRVNPSPAGGRDLRPLRGARPNLRAADLCRRSGCAPDVVENRDVANSAWKAGFSRLLPDFPESRAKDTASSRIFPKSGARPASGFSRNPGFERPAAPRMLYKSGRWQRVLGK